MYIHYCNKVKIICNKIGDVAHPDNKIGTITHTKWIMPYGSSKEECERHVNEDVCEPIPEDLNITP